mmetsp:Transcript_9039/g.15281  ORF Transcript_9039/g.15281 Transcript_9039/m.15281 type:complete len:229 (-) Transcript_9039:2364-3050(-)
MRDRRRRDSGPEQLHRACAPPIHGLDVIFSLLGNTESHEAWKVHGDVLGNVVLRRSCILNTTGGGEGERGVRDLPNGIGSRGSDAFRAVTQRLPNGVVRAVLVVQEIISVDVTEELRVLHHDALLRGGALTIILRGLTRLAVAGKEGERIIPKDLGLGKHVSGVNDTHEHLYRNVNVLLCHKLAGLRAQKFLVHIQRTSLSSVLLHEAQLRQRNDFSDVFTIGIVIFG